MIKSAILLHFIKRMSFDPYLKYSLTCIRFPTMLLESGGWIRSDTPTNVWQNDASRARLNMMRYTRKSWLLWLIVAFTLFAFLNTFCSIPWMVTDYFSVHHEPFVSKSRCEGVGRHRICVVDNFCITREGMVVFTH